MQIQNKIQHMPTTRHNKKLGSAPLPHSTDSEIAVIGAMMMSPSSAIPKAREILTADCFYNNNFKILFETLCHMEEDKKHIDIISLKEELKANGTHELIGGDKLLLEIQRKTPSSANVQTWALIVEEKFMRRQCIKISYDLFKLASDETQNVVDYVSEYSEKMDDLLPKNIKTTPDEDAIAYNQYLEKIKSGKIHYTPTGLRHLDNIINGFMPGDFVIIAARPSVGKSALGVTISTNIAYNLKEPVQFISIEMSRDELMNRITSQRTSIPLETIKKGIYTPQQEGNIIEFLAKHASSKFYSDCQISNIDDIVVSIKTRHRRDNVQLVVIDNFQNIRTNKKFSSEKAMNTYFSNTLRDLAKDLQIKIISLNQLNRNGDARSKKQPILSDLRDTGDLEQDAKIVIFIDRPEVAGRDKFDNGDDAKGMAHVIVAKNRDGRIGIAKLSYYGECARFQNCDPIPHPSEVNDEDKEF